MISYYHGNVIKSTYMLYRNILWPWDMLKPRRAEQNVNICTLFVLYIY